MCVCVCLCVSVCVCVCVCVSVCVSVCVVTTIFTETMFKKCLNSKHFLLFFFLQRRKITLNFNASPTHPTPTCTLHIDWETIEDKLVENLCIVIATDATGDATISFVSLRNAGDGVSLPEVGTNDSVKPLTVHVYGLERTERRIPYLYKACASGVKMLTYAGRGC